MPRNKQKTTDETIVSKLNNLWNDAYNERNKLDWKWFLYDMFYKGYHYAKYDTRTRQIVGAKNDDGRPKVVINKTFTTLRAVKNYATRNKPKAEVTPEDLSPDNLDQALLATKFLDYIHDREKLTKKLKGTILHALKYSVGWWQVIWDGEEIRVNQVDPFDFYPDPKATGPENWNYCVLAVERNIQDLKNDGKYDSEQVDKIKSSQQRFASSLKAKIMDYDNGHNTASSSQSDKNNTIIVKEIWYKEYDKKTKENKIMVAAMADDILIRKPEVIDTDRLPFFRLQSDTEPLRMYGEGWVKNLIDPNKMLDSAVSSIAEYNLLMNKSKYIADKGAGVRIINNQHGQILEKNRGFDVRMENIAGLNQAIYQQLQFSDKYIQDIGAIQDATMGRVPTGAQSGKAIEALQIGDSNNMSELVENIEEFLEDVYEYILWLTSKKYQELRSIVPMNRIGEREFVKIVGEDSAVGEQLLEQGVPDDTLVVRKNNVVRVRITSYLSHTPEAKREAIKELFQIIPDLPPDVILEAFGVGNIADVIKKIREKQEEDRQKELASQQDQQNLQNPQNGAQEAAASIRTLVQGGTPQVPSNPSQEYFDFIDQFLQREGQLGELPQEIIEAIQQFRDQVIQGIGRQ
jgi:hypothetical protein